MNFFVGLPEPSMAKHFERAFISVNRLRDRVSDFQVGEWIMDSGAYTEVARHGGYRSTVAEYAEQIRRWRSCGKLHAAVAQDWMCERDVLERTGKTVPMHQLLTVERYDELCAQDVGRVHLMPVLQGWTAGDYVDHLEMYGDRLAHGMWVGVGSVCRRNTNPIRIWRVLDAIKTERPDLRLHGFGLKATALAWEPVRQLLESADSMAWSYAARREHRDQNDWREARDWLDTLVTS